MQRLSSLKHLARDASGLATIEYLIIFVTVSLLLTFTVIWLGPSLIDYFELRVMWLSLPIP